MNALNSLMNPAAVGQQFTQAFEQGRERRRVDDTRSALSAFAMNPADENAFNALAQNAPEYAIQVRQQRDKAMQQQQAQDLQRRAAQGDQGALAELAGVDLDAWSKLDTRTQGEIKRRNDFMGQAALAVSQLPPAQQPQAWDSYVQQGVQMGFDDLAQYQGQYSPEAVRGLLAGSGLVKQFLDTQKIDYKVIPQGGYLQGFDNMGRPLESGVSTQGGGLQPGVVEDGFRYRGGDPADRNSWEPVGQGGGKGGATDTDRAADIMGRAVNNGGVLLRAEFNELMSMLPPEGQQRAQEWLRQNRVTVR